MPDRPLGQKNPACTFSPKGKLAPMFLGHCSGDSDRTLAEHLNGDPERQFFCGIYPGQDRPTSFKAISEIRC